MMTRFARIKMGLSLCMLLCLCACSIDKPQQQSPDQSPNASPNQSPNPSPNQPPKRWQTYEAASGAGQGRHVVLISGDEEYRSDEALSELGQILSQHHGFKATVLYAQDPDVPGVINPNYVKNIPGLKALRDADLMVIATRFRELPDEQMLEIENYLLAGKPVIGMRTATHAFRFPKESKWAHWSFQYDGELKTWRNGFGELVLGSTWINHHGWHKHESTRGIAAGDHKILNGINEGEIWGPSDVYGAPLPLLADSNVVVYGQVLTGMNKSDSPLAADPYKKMPEHAKDNPNYNKNYNKNDPMMPIAWTKSYQLPNGKRGKVFTTTMGASTDLVSEGTRRMIVNAAFWSVDLPVPASGTKVDIVQGFEPTMYGFESEAFWHEKQRRVSDFDLR
jgi:hypothetical protein